MELEHHSAGSPPVLSGGMTLFVRRDILLLATAGILLPAGLCRSAAIAAEPLEPEQAELLAWLKKAGPADWHRCACTWNWDQPFDVPSWIVRQPRCDAGTAVTLFARGEPSYYGQFKSLAEIEAKAGTMMETVRFLIEICERWQAGLYPAWRYRPDQLPELDPASLPWPVPATLARAEAKGEALDLGGWSEGFPAELYGR
jgi:hypothetical protein